MKTDPLTVSFVVHIDQREKNPFRFTGLCADAAKNKRPLIVPTEFVHMPTGDYTVAGFESRVCVERKSLADLFSTLSQHRERFEREHQRMAEMHRAMVVVEAPWYDVCHFPPEHSRLHPKTVFRTAVSWYARYGIPWIMAEDRRLAEIYTFRFLEKYCKEFSGGTT